MIYFIWSPRLKAVKIGCANDVSKRMKTLQCANPEPLILLGVLEGGFQREAELHRMFAELRLRPKGEWFRDDPQLRIYIGTSK